MVSLIAQTDDTKFNTDLSDLACNAAIELDNLRLRIGGVSGELNHVKQLFVALEQIVSNEPDKPSSLIDPTKMIVINRALNQPTDTIDAFHNEAKVIKKLLQEIAGDPSTFSTHQYSNLILLRDFCLKLSERASIDSKTIYQTDFRSHL